MESLEEVGNNPLLASLKVKAFEASQYQAIADFVKNSEFNDSVKEVDYYERKPVIEKIFSFTSNLNTVGIIMSVILAIVAVLVGFNTIRLAIYNSKEEIKIQRLVGADNWFIRGPFLAQGVISGFFAALGGLAVFSLVTFAISSKVEILFSGLNLFHLFAGNFWMFFFLQLFAALPWELFPASLP